VATPFPARRPTPSERLTQERTRQRRRRFRRYARAVQVFLSRAFLSGVRSPPCPPGPHAGF
jgi:hypothetical protein